MDKKPNCSLVLAFQESLSDLKQVSSDGSRTEIAEVTGLVPKESLAVREDIPYECYA